MKLYAWARGLVQTIPGIDEIGAALVLIEIGDDMRRFGSPFRWASWTALCSGNHESAGKRKSGKIRHSNPIVRYLLCKAANDARRTNSLVICRGPKGSTRTRVVCGTALFHRN